MVLLAAAAILGAAFGLVFRSAVLAVVLALAAAASAQFGAMSVARVLAGRAETSQLARSIEGVAGVHPAALIPTLAAAGGGAVVAVLLARWADGRRRGSVFIPGDRLGGAGRKGRRGAIHAAIEERPAHAAAESRIQTILKQ
jgi:hypothetical protein